MGRGEGLGGGGVIRGELLCERRVSLPPLNPIHFISIRHPVMHIFRTISSAIYFACNLCS